MQCNLYLKHLGLNKMYFLELFQQIMIKDILVDISWHKYDKKLLLSNVDRQYHSLTAW